MSNNQIEVVKFLYESGFDISLTDVRGNTAVDIARDNGLDAILDLFPKRDVDLAETIVSDCRKTFKETFEALEIDKKWVWPTVLFLCYNWTGFISRPAFFEDVCNILLSVKCEDLISLFYEKNVHLCEFLSMSDNDLKDVGVLLPYQRNRILTGLSRFHKQPYSPKSLHICIKNGSFR